MTKTYKAQLASRELGTTEETLEYAVGLITVAVAEADLENKDRRSILIRLENTLKAMEDAIHNSPGTVWDPVALEVLHSDVSQLRKDYE